MSIFHDLYFVCKAASVRSGLLQSLYKSVIISYCKVTSVRLESLIVSDISYPLILIKNLYGCIGPAQSHTNFDTD
jgi:hypothetical protein